MKRLAWMVLAIGLVVGVSAVPAGAGTEVPHPPPVFPPASHPFGVSYRQWAARWTQWGFGAPSPVSPFLDPANCDVGQSGPAWYLPPATATDQSTSCTVPAGKGLVVSPGGGVALQATGDGTTPAELLAVAKATTDDETNLSVTIDGQAVAHPERWRTTAVFRLVLPADNIFGVAGGPTLAAVDGYFLVVPPLHLGNHLVTVSDQFISDGSIDSLTYHITVVTRHREGHQQT